MTSSNGNIFRVTAHLCGEFTGHRWIPRNKCQWRGALMFSLICVWINGWVNNREAGDLRRHQAHYDVIVMYSLFCGFLFAITLFGLQLYWYTCINFCHWLIVYLFININVQYSYFIIYCDTDLTQSGGKYFNKSMKGQSEIAYLPKFANMMLIVMVIVITEILYIILIFDCFENQ